MGMEEEVDRGREGEGRWGEWRNRWMEGGREREGEGNGGRGGWREEGRGKVRGMEEEVMEGGREREGEGNGGRCDGGRKGEGRWGEWMKRWMEGGRERGMEGINSLTGQILSFGVPNMLIMQSIWWISDLPGRRGFFNNNSPNMHPIALEWKVWLK